MAIDLQNETLLTLDDAAKALKSVGGKKPHTYTIRRWCLKGCGGVLLESTRVGRRIMTSAEALQRFADARTQLMSPPPIPIFRKPRTPAQAKRAMDRANKILEEAGI